MTGRTARDVAEAFVRLLDQRDWPAWSALLHPDVIYELPQTRERIRGRHLYLQFNREYPGDWRLHVRTVLGDDGTDGAAVVLFVWTCDGQASDGIVFLEVRQGLAVKVTDYWPEPYNPPPGREHLVERW